MKTTFMAKKGKIQRKWYIVDGRGKILGRLASRVASILRGKHKSIFTPHIDTADGVIVINASDIKVTGRKLQQKIYRRFSGYIDGLKEVPLDEMLKKKPTTVVKLAVKRMLPKGPLSRDMLKKLKVYADDKHLHKSQNPIPLEV